MISDLLDFVSELVATKDLAEFYRLSDVIQQAAVKLITKQSAVFVGSILTGFAKVVVKAVILDQSAFLRPV